ncbi:MAG: PAS domain-containing protein [Capnocytophaga sp.]|nr:PAS domain-containing protein [Capnocytophaga sp.]
MKSTINKPVPIDEEVIWDKSKLIISSTDRFGTITDVNQTFTDVSGYSIDEVLGHSHNIIRHPDTPKIIFKVLWDNILAGRNFHVVIKNISKLGKYYWVITDFEVNRNSDGEIISFTAKRRAVSQHVIREHIQPLYETLLKLENIGGMDLSNRYFKGFLDKKGKSYVEYIMDIIGEDDNDVAYQYDYTNTQMGYDSLPTKEISDDIFNEDKSEITKRKNFFARLFSIN